MKYVSLTKSLVALSLFLCMTFGAAHANSQVNNDFEYKADRFADIQVLRYKIPDFDALDLKKKTLLYYLYEASLSGREVMFDQNYKHNLTVRRTLEAIYKNYTGDRTAEAFQQFEVYLKQVWFANGMHHHYSNKKHEPKFSFADLSAFVAASEGATFPTLPGESLDAFLARVKPIIFDPSVDQKKVARKADDKIVASAVNFYEGVTEAEVNGFYEALLDPNDPTPVSHGLNSKLVKEDGVVKEKVWKVGGMYGDALQAVVYWLEKALPYTENAKQRSALEKLIKYYRTGDLKDFDDYSIAWVNDTASNIDLINGFIEVYNDPVGMRGSYESVLEIVDYDATERMKKLADNAQWFENNAPIEDAHRKENVVGILARAVNVVVGTGDASPASPIGINLPNANWIRANHGSKSVNLSNIVSAYNHSASGSSLGEFAFSQDEIDRENAHGEIADILHTDLHEVIGHASGRILPGVGTPAQTLKEYASTLEEARADIFALYYIMDEKLIDLGLISTLDVGKTSYDQYIRNGLMLQLRRITLGDHLEEAHMQNRQLISLWAYEKGKANNVIEKVVRDGKTYFVIRDYQALRGLFGELLHEIQRIKSEGDYQAGKALVDNYGTHIDSDLHVEVLERYKALNIAPYKGFINPRLVPQYQDDKIVDVLVEYPDDFVGQMLEYSMKYSFLPNYN